MTQLRRLLLILMVLTSICRGYTPAIISDKDADDLTQLALKNFWGKAWDEHEHVIQPENEKDRVTVPVPLADARRIVHAAVPAGVAMWAGLDWESYYKAFMKKERSSRRWSVKQIAFIGVLFGVTQGCTKKSFETMPRDQKGREWATQVLAEARSAL